MIDGWAHEAEAKGLLPELVRRLIAATTDLTELAVRGAETNNFAGWDGSVIAQNANAWVPAERSRWEMGCSVDVIGKARRDFKSRTEDTLAEHAREMAFVFVTPRIWAAKDAWRQEAEAISHWRMVRAYDADDLATWVESAGSVALWLGERLRVRGPGITTVASYSERWFSQTKLPISRQALEAGRTAQLEYLGEILPRCPPLLTVRADSSEEAVAFVCAQLDARGLADRAACVTRPEGWAFVDAHPALKYLVAANEHVAAVRAPRDGQCLIVATGLGDPGSIGRGTRGDRDDAHLTLDRPDAQSFEDALVALGEEPTDASRWARSCGRSWSVYRRRRAANPAIAKPAWMDDSAATCLTAIVLVGAWNESKAGDRACIAEITGRRYEDFELDLLKLARLDDSPIIRIGNVWKAKAPLELLYLFAPLMTQDQLTRFFAIARAILAKPDPALELDPDKRWAAAIYGQVREESGIVIDSIADSLTKLRVYAEENQRHDLMASVDRLIRDLLENADAERWLSLSGVLRELAEASPELFLKLVDESLRLANRPVHALFSDRSEDPLVGRSYHVDLLWALEVLAWSPRHLGKACTILAALMDTPVKSNLSNRPSNSLISLLRPWWPQTSASGQRRVEVLDRLLRDHEEAAWQVLLASIPSGSMFASANAKPRWRDYDASAPRPNELADGEMYIPAIGQRLLDRAQGHAQRIAALVERLDSFDGEFRERLLAIIYGAVAFPDDERQPVRDALRKRLNWQFSFNDSEPEAMVEARALRTLFDALAPSDLVLRHAWIFASSWVELPDGKEEDYRETDARRATLRAHAFSEIFEASGWPGIERLAEKAETPWLVGWEIAKAVFLEADVISWALNFWSGLAPTVHDALLGGLLHGLSDERLMALLEAVRDLDTPDTMTRVLLVAPFDRRTWAFVDALPHGPRLTYWSKINPGMVIDEADLLYVVDKFIEVERHRTAFHSAEHHPKRVGSARLVTILNGISAGVEPDGRQLDSWRIGEALAALAADAAFPRRDLAVLEYRYFDALRNDHRHQARTLVAEMSRDAEFFMDVVCLATPGENEDVSSATRTHAWSVLHDGRGMPGLGADGIVDRDAFFAWTEGVRHIAQERNRTGAADSAMGTWLSQCPEEPGGVWPCVAVRELLEDPSGERIRNGFLIGVLNNRGVHWRGIGAGGVQERSLAAQYRAGASELSATFPHTADVLEDIAKSYDHNAKWHDDDAALWREGAS